MTLGDALAAATARLAEAGIESARLEAELLLARACDDCARALLYAELHRELSPEQEAAFDANVRRRVQREPLAYVLGEWGFRRLTLKTDRRALIPRPETEIVVERALEHIRDEPDPVRFWHLAVLTALRDKAERVEVRFGDDGTALLYHRVAGRDWELAPVPFRLLGPGAFSIYLQAGIPFIGAAILAVLCVRAVRHVPCS